ncbi:GrpB family protein [Knoellia sp. CPCC 206450]|uniref:GrpB family protein n=1 Tax=Knoellia tibetensis TaxID=3404798 RepID=UPI003B43B183
MCSAGAMDGLVWSDGLLDEARQVRARVATALSGLGLPGEVELIGGLSVPGALTKGDVDLHLRVRAKDFGDVVSRLRDVLPVASPHAWAATLAVFEVPGSIPTGLAVTPHGSEHDARFRLAWERLRADPSLLDEYNALKSDSVGTAGYEESKSRFFSALATPATDARGWARPTES